MPPPVSASGFRKERIQGGFSPRDTSSESISSDFGELHHNTPSSCTENPSALLYWGTSGCVRRVRNFSSKSMIAGVFSNPISQFSKLRESGAALNTSMEMHDSECLYVETNETGLDSMLLDAYVRRTERWLCPALLRYFDGPPPELFVEVKVA